MKVLPIKSKYKKFSFDILSLAGGQVFIAIIALVNSAVIARALGVEDRGFFVMAMLLPNILITFTDFGIGAAGTKFIASKKWDPSVVYSTHASIIVIRLMLIALTLFIITSFFSQTFFPGIPQRYLYLGSLLSISLAIQGLIFPILLGLGLGVKFSLILVSSALLSLAALTAGWLFVGLNVQLALILQISSSTIISIYILWTVFKEIGNIGTFSFTYLKEAFSFGSGIFVSIISTFANEKMILLILNYFGGVIYVSLYTISQALTERIYLLADSVGTMLMPKIAEDSNKNSSIYTPIVFKITLLITSILALILIALSEAIIIVIYTDEFFGSVIVMKVLLIAVIFSSGWLVLSQDLNGRGYTIQTAFINVVIAVSSLSLAIILLPTVGLVGAAIASIISYVIGLIIGVSFFIVKTKDVNLKNMLIFSSSERLFLKNALKNIKAIRRN